MSEDRGTGDEDAFDTEVLDILLMATAPVEPPPQLRVRVLERVRAGFVTLQRAEGWQPLMPGIDVKRLCVDERAGTKSSCCVRSRA